MVHIFDGLLQFDGWLQVTNLTLKAYLGWNLADSKPGKIRKMRDRSSLERSWWRKQGKKEDAWIQEVAVGQKRKRQSEGGRVSSLLCCCRHSHTFQSAADWSGYSLWKRGFQVYFFYCGPAGHYVEVQHPPLQQVCVTEWLTVISHLVSLLLFFKFMMHVELFQLYLISFWNVSPSPQLYVNFTCFWYVVVDLTLFPFFVCLPAVTMSERWPVSTRCQASPLKTTASLS